MSPSRTRPGWSFRAAGRPPRARLRDDRRGVRRAVALKDPRSGLAGNPLGAEQVLDGHRDTAERRAEVGTLLGGRVRHPGERVQLIGRGAFAVGIEQLGRDRSPGTDTLGCLRSRQLDQVAHLPAPGLGTPNPPATGLGRGPQRHLDRQRGLRLVGAQRIHDVDHVRGWAALRPGPARGSSRCGRAPSRARRPSARPRPRSARAAPGGRREEPGRGRASRAILGSSA